MRCWLLIIASVLLHIPTYAQGFKKEILIAHGDTLRFRLQYPAGYTPKERYPLVVFLHGSGERGSDNEQNLKQVPELFTDSAMRAQYPCFVLVPQCPANDAWASFPDFPQSIQATPEPTTSTRLVLDVVQRLKDRLNVDSNRIYLTGYSMGGEGTLDMLYRAPGLFTAGVAICPVGDTATAAAIKHIPLRIYHGTNDQVNEVKYSRMMVDALSRAGSKAQYIEYAGEGHHIWKQVYSDPDFAQWLFAQKN